MKETRLIVGLFTGFVSALGWVYVGPHIVDFLTPEPQRLTATITTVPVAQPANTAAPSWTPTQACGAPDSFQDADLTTAWAPATADGGAEWLEVEFAPARAHAVRIHETCNPGFVTALELNDPDGVRIAEVPVIDPVRSGASVTVVEFPRTKRPVASVRIRIDTARVQGWNEIDAVELVGSERSWARAAKASTFYKTSEPAMGCTLPPASAFDGWSARQAIGACDVPFPNADSSRAWCPRDPDAGAEWLEVDFAPQRASAVLVHQTFNPGAVVGAEAYDATGTLIGTGTITGDLKERVLKIDFPLSEVRTARVKVLLDTKRVPDYNEIDAVEILGPDGHAFATDARASSSWKTGDPIVTFPVKR